MNYRHDIDGLRSLAVLLVILNHAGFSFLPGGFIGVDVFFVISGFLITGIISTSISNKSFSFSDFLARRIKRLMPMLFVVVFVSTVIFSFILLPQDLSKYYRSILWVIFYGGNFFFWREHGGYFNGDSQEAPLLHTWSLAVEEQFYLIWPLILFLLLKYSGKKLTVIVVGLGCIAATVVSQWGTETTIGAAYYLLPTRFFELMAGAWLALAWHHLPVLNHRIKSILSLTGLGLIIAAAIMLTKESPFPGYNAIYPVLGTALIIYSATGIVNKCFSLKPFVFIGNLSYSMYLWHWPIFVFVRYTATELTLVTQIICMALTMALSLLSWKYIETPLRRKKTNEFIPVAKNMFVKPALALSLFAVIGIVNEGFPQRFSASINEMEQALNSNASESRNKCHSASRHASSPPREDCLFGDTGENQKNPSVFIFGDSHANHIVPFLEQLLFDAELTGQDYTLDSCVPIFDLNWGANPYRANICRERNTLADKYIVQHPFDYVVLAGAWPRIGTNSLFTEEHVTDNPTKEKLIREKLTATIRKISATGAIPVLIEDTPYLKDKGAKCPLKKQLFNSNLDCKVILEANVFFTNIVNDIKKRYPQLIVIQPRKLMCEGSVCSSFKGGIPLFLDKNHLNEKGSKLLGEYYLKTHHNPLTDL